MDPFQIRLECLSLVRRLSASQQSIQKVVDFAMRHASSAADDVWDCLVSECARAGLNAKLNILFLLDALLLSIVDPVGHAASCNAAQAQASAAYLAMALRDLRKIVDAVVPHDRSDAVRLNAGSTQKVLESWRNLQLFDSELLRGIEDELEARKNSLATEAPHKLADFSRQDIQRRMEEDRERHKRLRERAWILPGKSYQNMIATTQPLRTTTAAAGSSASSSLVVSATQAAQAAKSSPAVPLGHQGGGGSMRGGSLAADDGQGGRQSVVDAVEIDFDELWETVSDLNEDDLEALDEDDAQWWGSSKRAKEGAQLGDATSKNDRTAQDDGRGDKRGASILVDDDDEEARRQRRRLRREQEQAEEAAAAAAQQQGHRWRSSLTGPSGFRPIATAARR